MLEVQADGNLREDVRPENYTALPLLRADKASQVKIVGFRAKHGQMLSSLPYYILTLYEYGGEGYTAFIGSLPICAAGVVISQSNTGSAWAMIGQRAKEMPFWLHRAVKRKLNETIKRRALRR